MEKLPAIQSQGERAAALAIILDAKLSKEQFPNLRKVGRYIFFAVCAFGMATSCGVFAKSAGFSYEVLRLVFFAAFMVSFIALRDMSKAWDIAVYSAAETRRYLEALTEGNSPVGNAAAPTTPARGSHDR